MENLAKRILAFLLVLCMLVPMCAPTVTAEGNTGSSAKYDFQYNVENGTDVFGSDGKAAIDALYNSGAINWTPYGSNVENVLFQNTQPTVQVEDVAAWDGISATGAVNGSYIAFSLKNPGEGEYELILDYRKAADGVKNADAYLIPASAAAGTTLAALTGDDAYKLTTGLDFVTGYETEANASVSFGDVAMGADNAYILVLKATDAAGGFMGIRSIALVPNAFVPEQVTYNFGGGPTTDALPVPIESEMWTVVAKGSLRMFHLTDRIQANSFEEGPKVWFVVEIKNSDVGNYNFTLTGNPTRRAAEVYVIEKAPAVWDNNSVAEYTRENPSYMGIFDNSKPGATHSFTAQVDGDFFLLFKATNDVFDSTKSGGHFQVCSLVKEETQDSATTVYNLGYSAANKTDVFGSRLAGVQKQYAANQINWMPLDSDIPSVKYMSTSLSAGSEKTSDWDGIRANGAGVGAWIGLKVKNPGLSNTTLSIDYHKFEKGAQSANVYFIPASALSAASVEELTAGDTYKFGSAIDFKTGYDTGVSASADLGAVDFGAEEYAVLVLKVAQTQSNDSADAAVMGIEGISILGELSGDHTAQYPLGSGAEASIRLSTGTQLNNLKVYRGNFTLWQRTNDLSAVGFVAGEQYWIALEIENQVPGNFEMTLAAGSSRRAAEVYLLSEAPSSGWTDAAAADYTPSSSSYKGILDCSTAQTRQLTFQGSVNGKFWILFKGTDVVVDPSVSGGNLFIQSLSITQLPEARTASCSFDANLQDGTQVFGSLSKSVLDARYTSGESIWVPYGTNIKDISFCSTTVPVITESLASWDGINADGFGIGSWIAFKIKNPGKGLYELAVDYQKSAYGAQSVNAYLFPASSLTNTTIDTLTADDTYKLDTAIDFKKDYQQTPSATTVLGNATLSEDGEYILVLRVAKTCSESEYDSAYMGLKGISLTPPLSELLNKTYSFGGASGNITISIPHGTDDWTVVAKGSLNVIHAANRLQANSFREVPAAWFVVEIKNNVADTLDFVLTGDDSMRAAEIYLLNEAPDAWNNDTVAMYNDGSDAFVGIMDNSTAEGRTLRFTETVNGNFYLLFKATDKVGDPDEEKSGNYKVLSLNACQSQSRARITYDLGYDTANGTNALDTACKDAIASLYNSNRINWQLFQTNIDSVEYYSSNITADGKPLSADWSGIAVNSIGTGKWFAAKLKNPGTGYYRLSMDVIQSLDGAQAASVYLIPESKLSGKSVEALIGSNEYKVYSNLSFNGAGDATVTTSRIQLNSKDAYILVIKAETTCNGSATNKTDAAYMWLKSASLATTVAPKTPNAVYDFAPYGQTIPGTSTVLQQGSIEKYAPKFENAYRGEWNWKYYDMDISFEKVADRASFRKQGYLRIYSTTGEWIAFTIKSPGEGTATVGVNIPVIGESCASEIGVYILPKDTADVSAAITDTANRVGVYDAEPHGGLISVGTMTFRENEEYIVVFKVESDSTGSDHIYLKELVISQNFVPKAEYPEEEPPIIIVPGASDKAAADAVIAMINSIGTNITLASQGKIEDARFAYDCLTDAQKAMVTNYDALLAAEAALDALLGTENQKYADPVIALIDAIGEVTLESADKIKAARDAYSELTGAQAALVTNYPVLVAAEAKLRELQNDAEKGPDPQEIFDRAAAETVEALIAAIGTVTLDSEYAISTARNAYNALTSTQSVLVKNYDVLVAAEGAYAELKAANEARLAAEQKSKHITIMVVTASAVVLSVAVTLFIVPTTRKKLLSLFNKAK